MAKYISVVVALLGAGCSTTSSHVPAMAKQTNTQSLDDKQMLAIVKNAVLGLEEKSAIKRLKEIGFSDEFVTTKPGETRRLWCKKEDNVSLLVVKKWNVVLYVGDFGDVTSVEVSSGLVGP